MRNIMGRRTKLAAAVLAGFVIAGCASLGALGVFKEPIVTFKDLRVRGLGLSGGSLDAYLNIYNPNGFRLDATRLSYTVTVGDNAQVGTGILDSRFAVQDKDSTTVRIPIDFTYSGIGAAARQIMQSGSGPYNAKGGATGGAHVGNLPAHTEVS